MMVDGFDKAVKIVLEDEGVFSDDDRDPGGQTWYGIDRAAHPDIPWPPTKDQAIAIYRSEYWDRCRCGEMNWRWALAVFEGVVNQGPGLIAMLQKLLGTRADNTVGPATLAAINSADDYHLDLFYTMRVMCYIATNRFPDFGRGWIRRAFKTCREGVTPPEAET
jgi:lysozyme family protein